MDELISRAKQLQQQVTELSAQLNVDKMEKQLIALKDQMGQPGFWDDQQKAQQLTKQLSDLEEELLIWKNLQEELTNISELAELNKAEGDVSLSKDLEAKLIQAQELFAGLEFKVLLSGEYDAYPAIVTLRAGAGGVDAQDWTEMLLRMITRYSERQGFKVSILDISRGTEAGIKSATLAIDGRYAYGYLRSEHGVHRLVRQSPFNSDALRQTSFAMIEILPDLGDLSPIEIKDEDIRIDVFRAGGNGGQSVNTTDSAVRIVHIPTDITVTCQNEKSQRQNKDSAMKILMAKLTQLQMQERAAKEKSLKGESTSAEWGNQIRSYVLHPYKMVKDHRTNHEVKNPDAVLDGKLDSFIEAYLRDSI